MDMVEKRKNSLASHERGGIRGSRENEAHRALAITEKSIEKEMSNGKIKPRNKRINWVRQKGNVCSLGPYRGKTDESTRDGYEPFLARGTSKKGSILKGKCRLNLHVRQVSTKAKTSGQKT